MVSVVSVQSDLGGNISDMFVFVLEITYMVQ
jgi:hypothetical protein